MYTRLRRQRLRDLVQVMLFVSGHKMTDAAREEFLDSIQEEDVVRTERRGPAPSRAFFQDAGIRVSRG